MNKKVNPVYHPFNSKSQASNNTYYLEIEKTGTLVDCILNLTVTKNEFRQKLITKQKSISSLMDIFQFSKSHYSQFFEIEYESKQIDNLYATLSDARADNFSKNNEVYYVYLENGE
jgi:hypothetical protein